MNFWLLVLILAAIDFFAFFKIPEWIRKRKLRKNPIYEVRNANK
jgi:hypothetical protein